MEKKKGKESKQIAIGTDRLEDWGINKGTAANKRWKKEGIRYFKVGRKVLYLVSDVEDWIKRHQLLTKDFVPEQKRRG